MTWIPALDGRTIDLLAPVAEQVDFADIAWSLAHTNRYAGHGFIPVSVGLHTLIGVDLAPEPLRPWWLLHDAHESRIGDHTTPAKQALQAIGDILIEGGGMVVKAALAEFTRRHDEAIHEAAGLPMPDGLQIAAIRKIDIVALATEHRDFHRPSVRKWQHELDGIEPAKRPARFRQPDKVADELHAKFRRYLPALGRAAFQP